MAPLPDRRKGRNRASASGGRRSGTNAAPTLAGGIRPMPKKDAIGFLKEQHVEVKKMLAELAETTERATKRRTELVREVKAALDAHTTIEEEIFYPRFRDAS